MTLKQEAFKSKASQEGWELWQVLKQVAELRPITILEIGCDGGGMLETLTTLFPKANIIGVDILKRPELDKYQMIYGDSGDNSTVEAVKKAMGKRSIDFLWIDGDHHYQVAKRDFELFAPLVRPGGIVGFHDTNSRGIDGVEVKQFLNELDQHWTYRSADFRLNRMSPGSRLIWL